MIIPEKLYQVLAKDRGAPGPRVFNERITLTAAASTAINGTLTNSTGLVLVICVIGVNASPGAAQKYTGYQLRLQDAGGNVLSHLGSDSDIVNTVAATAYQRSFYPNACWVAPNQVMRAAMTFDAGANSNSGFIYLHGIAIPAGTLLF